MSLEDIYFWNKNGRPGTEKEKRFNALCRYKLRFLKTSGVILKTYHLDFGEGQCSKRAQNEMDLTIFNQDIAPFTKYSINKKKRWEVNVGVPLLGKLQEIYDDMEISLFERVQLKSSPFVCQLQFHSFYFSRFPIQRIHKILPDNSYQCTSVNSVFGQQINNFLAENRSSEKTRHLETLEPKIAGRPKVAYHFISSPKNYEILQEKKFHPGKRRRERQWWWPLMYVKMDWRPQIAEDLYEAITYDAVEDLEWDDVHEWDEDPEEEETGEAPEKFYNLEDHIVDHFVVVKRKKRSV